MNEKITKEKRQITKFVIKRNNTNKTKDKTHSTQNTKKSSIKKKEKVMKTSDNNADLAMKIISKCSN